MYLSVVVLAALAQDWLLFPRWATSSGSVSLPVATERLSVELPTGGTLVGHLVAADQTPPRGAAFILGFGGNAWSVDVLAEYLHAIFPDRDVITLHYRGYGPSSGRPSARALLEDAVRVHDAVNAKLASERIVAVGFSLGAGPAAHLARQRGVAGLILVTPLDSLRAMARDLCPWLPVRLLLRHCMEIAEALDGVADPVAVITAEADSIVPPERSIAVRRAASNLILDRTIADAGHNDPYDREEFQAAMREALKRIEKSDDGRPADGTR
jgi:pimeloyl-ACP methyl ester carboxylesterase